MLGAWRARNELGHRPAGRGTRLLRYGALSMALLLLFGSIAVACGGDDDDDAPQAGASPTTEDDGIEVIRSTFTPTPPDFTPEALQTKSALQTAEMQTQEAGPQATATNPTGGTADTSTSPDAGPTRTPLPEGTIRPPDVVLRTQAGELSGEVGGFVWWDPDEQTGGGFGVPYVVLPNESVILATDTTGRLDIADTPYPPRSTALSVYEYGENVSIPTDESGQPKGDQYAFLPKTDPAQELTLNGTDLSFQLDVAPGQYIVDVRIVWDAPEDIEKIVENQPLSTQYVYVVTVI